MKLVSWNVNSIKARKDYVLRFLTESKPDILMLQELKGLDFPAADFESIGYHCQAVTQKAYNGVALISKDPIDIIHTALPGNESDEQARYIEANINDIRVINIYLPNGNPVEDGHHEKFQYKLNWMNRLVTRVKELRQNRIPFVIGGDFNIIPAAQDCKNIKDWEGDAAHHPASLRHWRALLNNGLYDAFRIFNKSSQNYTFWDYQAGAWQKNNGIRIDHFLTCPLLTDRIQSCEIDKEPRGWDRPSDHTPIALTLNSL